MRPRIALLTYAALTVGCGARTGLTVGGEPVATADAAPIETCDWVNGTPRQELVLANDLEYPKGLWVRGCRVYFTETAGRNSGTRGKVALGVYDLFTHERSVILDAPKNCDAVAVDAAGHVFLASPDEGDTTSVSLVDPVARTETPLASVPFQFMALTLSSNGDLFVAGHDSPAVGPTARSLFRLPANRWGEPALLASGLGLVRCVAERDGDVYVSSTTTGSADGFGLRRVSPTGAVTRMDGGFWGTNAMSLSRTWVYGMDDGGVWREKLTELHSPEVLSTSMPTGSAAAIQWVPGLNALVYLDRGTPTPEGRYKSGSLRLLTQVE